MAESVAQSLRSTRRPQTSRARPCRWGVALTLIGMTLWASAAPSAVAGPSPKRTRERVVIFVLDRVSWYELTHAPMPHWRLLTRNGAVGLMNTRVPRDPTAEAVWVTLSAGRVARAGPEIWRAIDAVDVAAPPAVSSVGIAPSASQAVIHAGAGALSSRNPPSATGAQPGLLGDELQRAGLRTAVIGNSDRAGAMRRAAALLVMNRSGRVDMGAVGSEVLMSASDSADLRTDPDATLAWLDAVFPRADVIVMDLGDAARVDRDSRPGQLSPSKREALGRADRLLGQCLERFDRTRTLVVVVSPLSPDYENHAWRTAAPVVLAGPGVEPGLLTSAGTRRVGVVSNCDFAPTILDWFGLAIPRAMDGREMTVRPQSRAAAKLTRLDRQLADIYRLRFPLIPIAIAWQVAGMVWLVVVSIWGRPRSAVGRGIMRGWAGVALGWPLAFLVPAGAAASGSAHAALIALVVIGVGALLWRTRAPLTGVAVIGLATAGALTLDALAGARLLRQSLMGYDAIMGTRFYGLGNEYMGVLLAMLLIGIGAALPQRTPLSRNGSLALGALSAGVVLAIGAPFWGANWGGAVTAAAGLSVAWVLFRGRRITLATVVMVVLLTGLAGAVVVGLDLLGDNASRSHIGRSLTVAATSGFDVRALVGRKLAMNLRLIHAHRWDLLFPLAVVALWAALRGAGRWRGVWTEFPRARAGLVSALVAALVALVTNDSGIIAAGAMIGVVASAMLWMVASRRTMDAYPGA